MFAKILATFSVFVAIVCSLPGGAETKRESTPTLIEFENKFDWVLNSEQIRRKRSTTDVDPELLQGISTRNQPKQVKKFFEPDHPILIHGYKYPPDPKDYQNSLWSQKKIETHSECPKNATGLFVYSLSCSKFLNCWKGRGYPQNCPPGTLFNPRSLECDYSSKVKCLVDAPNYVKEVNGNSLKREERKVTCPEGFTGMVPHHSDCSKYVFCNYGTGHDMLCPTGTLFTLKNNSCVQPGVAECPFWTKQYDGSKTTYFQDRFGQTDTNYDQQPSNVYDQNQNHYGNSRVDQNWIGDNYDDYKPSGSSYSPSFSANQNDYNQNSFPPPYKPPSNTVTTPNFYGNPNNNRPYNPEDPQEGQIVQTSMDHFGNHQPTSKRTPHTFSYPSPKPPPQNPNFGSQNPYGKPSYNQGGRNVENGFETTNGKPTCPRGASGVHPHPFDCSKFLNCANGITYVQDCGPGTLFNPSLKVCDFPYRVVCSSRDPLQAGSDSQGFYVTKDSSTTQSYPVEPSGFGRPGYRENRQNSNGGYFRPGYHGNNQQGSGRNVSYYDQDSAQTQYYDFGIGNRNKVDDDVSPTPPLNQDTSLVPSTDTNADYEFGAEDGVQYPEEGSTNLLNREKCAQTDFRCDGKSCIPPEMVCDDIKDCPNGLDEVDCNSNLKKFIFTPNSLLVQKHLLKLEQASQAYCARQCLLMKTCLSFSYRKENKTCFLTGTNVGQSGSLVISDSFDYYESKEHTLDCSDLYICKNKKCIHPSRVCDGVDNCGDREDEKNCSSKALNYTIKLEGGSSRNEGRILVQVFNKSGYICDDKFGLEDANVVCKELGFPLGAVEVKGNSYFSKGLEDNTTNYMMDDVACSGNETTLKECDFSGWGIHDCKEQEVAGVICKTPQDECPKDFWKCDTNKECLSLPFLCDGIEDCTDKSDEVAKRCSAPVEIRLAGGPSKQRGRLEIKYKGLWGTVCDDDFNDDAAKVVCSHLGFSGKAVAKKNAYFGQGRGPIWLDQVYCQGNETRVEECYHWNWGEHNCEHSEDVGVICDNYEDLGSQRSAKLPKSVSSKSAVLNQRCGLKKDAIFTENDDVHFRMVKGSIARPGDYPWQASLKIKNKSQNPSQWCGAIVVSSKFVLTAAHCLHGFPKGSYLVVAGDYNVDEEEGTEQKAYIEDYYIHEKFRQGNRMGNDIALIKLKGDGFNMTEDVQPICLPEKSQVYTPGMNCTISGFGTTQSGISAYSHSLRAGWVPIQSEEVCKMAHVYGKAFGEGMICAGYLEGGIDACDGDSGGPLACLHQGYYTLYGIISWGHHCGYANKPGVYVKVADYRDWIDEIIRKHS